MEKENIEFKDGYDFIDQQKVRSIKNRENSYNGIYGIWHNWRLSALSDDLSKSRKKLLTENYKTDFRGNLTEKSEANLEKKVAAIAKIEQDIKILTGEYVPDGYTISRAIKLKENMMANLRFNSDNAYSVGLDKHDQIFSEEESKLENAVVGADSQDIAESDAPKVYSDIPEDVVIDNNQIPVEMEGEVAESFDTSYFVPNAEQDASAEPENYLENILRENSEKMAEEVRAAVGGYEQDEHVEDVSSEIGSQQIDETLRDEYAKVGDEATPEVDATDSSYDTENPTDSYETPGTTDEASNPELDYTAIKEELDEALGNIRVSRGGTAAKLGMFDEDGQLKEKGAEITQEEIREALNEAMSTEEVKYDYKPMTDEEIAQARENIEYDKYEEIYHNEKQIEEDKDESSFSLITPEVRFDNIFKPIKQVDAYEGVASPVVNFESEEKVDGNVERELPMVVPERYEAKVKEHENTDEVTHEEGLHFDYSTATAAEVKEGVNRASSSAELVDLLKRAEELKERQRMLREEREAAEKVAEEAARRAQEIKEAALAKQRDYEKRLDKLRSYTEALAEDVKISASKIERAKNDAESNERYVEEQEAKAKGIDNMIREIDSIIGPEAINVRGRK